MGTNLKPIIFTFLFCFIVSSLSFGQSYWQISTPPTKNGIKLRSVTYGKGLYVAVGDSGRIVTSRDGYVWKACTVATDQTFYCVQNCADTFVAGSDRTLYSSVDGVMWKVNSISLDGACISIAYGADSCWKFATILSGHTVDQIFWGKIGLIRWHSFPSCGHPGNSYVSLIYGNSKFVAVGKNGAILAGTGRIYKTPAGEIIDCQEWATHATYNFNSIVYVNGKYVATAATKPWDFKGMSDGGDSWALTSSDCKTWVKTYSFGTYCSTVAYFHGRFIIVGYNGLLAVSTDGISWSKKQIASVNINSVTWGPPPPGSLERRGQFVAVGDQGLIMRANDDQPIAVETDKANRVASPKINVTVSNSGILIKLPMGYFSGPVAVQLFNIAGRKVCDVYVSPQNGQLQIPVSGYSAGVYQLVMYSKGNKFARTITIAR